MTRHTELLYRYLTGAQSFFADLVETIIYQGFPHHYVVGYSDVTQELTELAKLWDLKVV